MIYVVGDLHGDLSKIKISKEEAKKTLNKQLNIESEGLASSSEIPDYQAHMKCLPQALKNSFRLSPQIFSASEENLTH